MPQPDCPSVDHVMARTDGGLARVRRPGGRIEAAGLEAVADAARRWGNGVVELTNRANLQLRGIRPGVTAELAEAFQSAGVSRGPAGDRRRNLLVGPLTDVDPTAVDFAALLGPLLDALDADPRFDGLNDKFGMALDGGGTWPLTGRSAAVVVTPGARPGTAVIACGWAPPRTVGQDRLVPALVSAALESLSGPYRAVVVPGTAVPAAGPLGQGEGWVGAMPELGRTDPATLTALAALAREHSGGSVRLTPWRGVVFARPSNPTRLVERLRGLDLIVDPEDPAAGVVACAGSTGCVSGLADAMHDARRVIAARRAGAAPVAGVHVSGCAKCCAQRTPGPLTLVATPSGGYDLYRSGQLDSAGLPAPDAVAEASR